ncbi:hypothetical protein FHP88_15745 [Sedimenticola selenatireducens]|uniref:Uncharacterized protein n=1 Tax=Sedimenticola selenatireducens TaxID=191960 RepID=A0A557S0K8_9GAMM|nr:hypothetical protein [Sedimenticola selenatireducens]TVO70906.1 hypothetical protein FHP88_15745 [Sedimenticola selenatireducens]
MSDMETIRAAIVAKLNSITDIGMVHAYERYAKNSADMKKLYLSDGRFKGWHVRRVTTREKSPATGRWARTYRWKIRGFMALDDADKSEQLFDAFIELICDAVRADDTLGGVVDSCIVGEEAGVQVQDSGPVMFAGVLCHSADLALNTRVYL